MFCSDKEREMARIEGRKGREGVKMADTAVRKNATTSVEATMRVCLEEVGLNISRHV